MSKATQIDPRGPRFGAAIVNIASLITFWLALDDNTNTLGYTVLVILAALFAIGAIFGNTRHPFGLLYKKAIRPLLKPAKELEDSRPPQFAQAVGLFVSLIGAALHLAGVRYGVAIAAGALFAASTLQAYFGYCLGCQIYLGLKRAGIFKG